MPLPVPHQTISMLMCLTLIDAHGRYAHRVGWLLDAVIFVVGRRILEVASGQQGSSTGFVFFSVLIYPMH